MQVVESIQEMQLLSQSWKTKGCSVGAVPTMGALHEGHMSLVDLCSQNADKLVVTIFVNPTQFAPGEDLDKYPRTFDRDKKLCEEAGVDAIFFPSVSEMYPGDSTSWVSEEILSQGFCGGSRPTHFRGVTTIVTKLYNAVLPDVAVFGEKDYQQLQVLRRITRDLNFPIQILPGPIFRESSGLAMSSRNRYLSEQERKDSLIIYKSLKEAASRVEENSDLKAIRQFLTDEISSVGGNVDYIETVNADSLEKIDVAQGSVRCLVAAHFGPARLLDNIQLL
ncbi:MAG: pantoate--beta-alanine ligase [Lentisphaeraceae bacterium]|nr:pantoate--beta-alanine ligase [Lentisphaeraceae bacterium]